MFTFEIVFNTWPFHLPVFSFVDDSLHKSTNRIEFGEALDTVIHSDRIAKLIQVRLEMQAPYISKWSQALSIQVAYSKLVST